MLIQYKATRSRRVVDDGIGKRLVRAGLAFEVKEDRALLAQPATSASDSPKRTRKPKDPAAAPKPKRTYKRRDMQAET